MGYHDKMFQLGMQYTTQDGNVCRWNGYLIKTTFVRPPIPDRKYDWRAYLDGMEENSSLYGYGKTESEAISDLIMNCQDNFHR